MCRWGRASALEMGTPIKPMPPIRLVDVPVFPDARETLVIYNSWLVRVNLTSCRSTQIKPLDAPVNCVFNHLAYVAMS